MVINLPRDLNMCRTPFSRLLLNERGRNWRMRSKIRTTRRSSKHRLGCLWSDNWGTIAVEVLMLMLVQVLVMMLMTFIMHEL